MKKTKKRIILNGCLMRPLMIGQTAIIQTGRNIYYTSPVVSIHEQNDDSIHFETLNANYYLSMAPFPCAAISPLPMSLAA